MDVRGGSYNIISIFRVDLGILQFPNDRVLRDCSIPSTPTSGIPAFLLLNSICGFLSLIKDKMHLIVLVCSKKFYPVV